MMKYRLKDQELQKKLDGLTKGAFSKWLLEQADINGFGDGTTYGVKLGEAIELGVLVRSEAVEVIHEYDPNDWNAYPDVTPPEGVLMLVECIDEDDKTFKTCAEYVGDGYGAYYWRNEYEIDVPVKRFRPLE